MSHILLFTRCMDSGGTEKVIIALARCYRDAGHRVYVCGEDGPGVEPLRRLGVEFFPIPDMQRKSPGVMGRIFFTVLRILREKNVDVVHTHHRMAAFYARLLRPFHPFVFLNNVHNTFEDKKLLTRFAMKKAVNIAVGQAVRQNLIQDYGLPEQSVRVIPNAVEPPDMSFRPDKTLAELREAGQFLVANVGRVNEQKGFPYYLETAGLLRNLPITFLVVGDGVQMEQTRALARDMGLDGKVVFLGYRTDAAQVMAQCDLVALSSLWEGFPLTPIEAFSVGKTLVATDVPGTMEIVKDGVNGLIVPKRDPQAMAEAIQKLYADPALRTALEAGARKSYGEEYSFSSFQNRYLELLKEALHERAS